jgi:hypothetical protein
MRFIVRIACIPTNVIQPARVWLFAAGAGGIFPFGLGGQTIAITIIPLIEFV